MFKALMHPEVRAQWERGDSAILRAHRLVWHGKPLIRQIYMSWWDQIAERLAPGPILEIGAGIGEFRRYVGRRCVSTDVLPGADVDLRSDGAALPFPPEAFSNVVCVDVLHHIADAGPFLAEVERVLQPRGRFVLVEPYVSPFAYLVRRLFHHEESERHAGHTHDGESKEALSGEISVPTRLFSQKDALAATGLRLELRERKLHSLLLYPLSGGFTYRSLIPDAAVPIVARIERILAPAAPVLALKMLVLLEKPGDGGDDLRTA